MIQTLSKQFECLKRCNTVNIHLFLRHESVSNHKIKKVEQYPIFPHNLAVIKKNENGYMR
uniref:Uncharacterized protein n=1 Tax=Onchocerca volvulus TaxID=6282 RepID=A0A8R1TNS5_ONCVO